jgi:hypothetical protein
MGGRVLRLASVGDSRVMHFTVESLPADSHKKTNAV